MSVRANERVAWFNGEFMPEREVRIPFRDSSWVYGDGCFDMTRSFGHRLFKVKEHVDRLYRSLKYLRIDPGFGPEKMCALTEELFERNRHLLGPDDDYWVGQRISRGVKEAPGDNLDSSRAEHRARMLAAAARAARQAVQGGHPRRHPLAPPRAAGFAHPARQDPQLPQPRSSPTRRCRRIDPEAWAVLLDVNGNLCEGMGSNIFTVRDGEILTPREKFVLPGVSRQTVIDLAARGGHSRCARPTSTSTTPTTPTRCSSPRPRSASAR